MPVKALTNKTLEALKAQAKRYEVHDLLCPGMSVRVSAQGQKVFSVKFRYGLNQTHMPLSTSSMVFGEAFRLFAAMAMFNPPTATAKPGTLSPQSSQWPSASSFKR